MAALSKLGRRKDPSLEARRKAEILAVAARVFAACGYAETNVDVIANHVGVGKGTVYRYFPTKEKLFLATVDQGLGELSQDVDSVIADPTLEPLVKMRRVIHNYFTFFARRPEMVELFIQERATFRDRHHPRYFAMKTEKDCGDIHAVFVGELIAGGCLREIPTERFMNVVGDLLYGTIMTNYLTGRQVSPADQTHDVLDILFHGILSDRERKRHTRKSAKLLEGK